MFISAKLSVYTENDVVYLKAKLPRVMGKHELRMALRTPVEVNDLINDLVKAKNKAFESGATIHKANMEREGGE